MPDRRTPAIVLGCFAHGGLAVTRTLGRLGVPVYCIDRDWATPAFHSRYCRGRTHFDMERASVRDTLAMLGVLSETIGTRAVLIPTGDLGALFLAENANSLRDRFIFPSVGAPLVRSLCSKREMYQLARFHGVPTPETVFPKSRIDVLAFLDVARFPILLKPIFSNLPGRTVPAITRVDTARALLERYDATENPSSPNLMLQEFIPGGDDQTWVFNGYFDQEGACRLALTGRKIRNYPPGFGQASSGVCERNRDVEELTIRFMRQIGYRGCLDIGYRFDPRDSKYKVNDVNPRVGAMFRCFVGEDDMDVVRALYQDMIGRDIAWTRQVGRRHWRIETNDLYSSIHYWRSGTLSWREWRAFMGKPAEKAYLHRDDVAPIVAALAVDARTMFRRAIAKLRRWLFGRPRTIAANPVGTLSDPVVSKKEVA